MTSATAYLLKQQKELVMEYAMPSDNPPHA